MGGSYVGKSIPRQRQRKQSDKSWLLNLSVTALAAGTLLVFGHWFSGRQGRRLGGDGRRRPSREDKTMDAQELRLRRLKAAEARLHPSRCDSSSTTLTALGMILELTKRADKLEEETMSLVDEVSARVMSSFQEEEQVRLVELLASLQLEIDAVQTDECIQPHKRNQTDRIQRLIAKLGQLKHTEAPS